MDGLADSIAREQAVTTFDQNVVVEAGAGTGKTTLLIDRLVRLLLRAPNPVDIKELVALTFTNKAANELKVRLRERLQAFLALDSGYLPPAVEEELFHQLDELRSRYYVSKDQIDEHIVTALRDLEKAQIGTIHSFAAHLLRLYPLEAGIDPGFKEDEGDQFDQLFKKEWALWLDQELASGSRNKELWKGILRQYELQELEVLSRSLCNPANPLISLRASLTDNRIPSSIRYWLEDLVRKAERLLTTHEKQVGLRQMLISAQRAIQKILHQGIEATKNLGEDEKAISKQIPGITKGWSNEDYQEAKEIIQVAKLLFQIEHKLLLRCLDRLLPFVMSFQKKFLQSGFISFDGLLVLARNLLQEHTQVRESLKLKYKAILVDEFQDTDPIQYEIILYLAEELGCSSPNWQSIRLAPGKLFIVGDPKQSIYSFRRADIEAYHRVVHEIIQRQNGLVIQLRTNFRSHVGILNPINMLFRQIIRPKAFLQPPYVDLVAYQNRPARLSSQKVEFRIVDARQDGLLATEAVRVEAEALARWLKEEVLEREVILDNQAQECRVQPGHIAFLFRKLTPIQEYLEALRRYEVPFIVEGERHFYTIQEVLDFINLLRTIEDPYNMIALVGVLRSPLGGLTDREIYQLKRLDLLDYRKYSAIAGVQTITNADLLKEFFAQLYQLHKETRALPISDALEIIFDRLPVLELAAASFHQEQAIANLKKIQCMAQELGSRLDITLKSFINLLEERIEARKEEGESPIVEEGVNAVRIMSIHKAKGLEFPMVVLAGLQSKAGGWDSTIWIQHDWSQGITGIRMKQYWNLAGIYLNRRAALREEEEEKRLLYVAMTRARERLVLSGVLTRSYPNPLNYLISLIEKEPENTAEVEIHYLPPVQPLPGKRVVTPPQPEIKEKSWTAYARIWQRREEVFQATIAHKIFLTPTPLPGIEQRFFLRRDESRGELGQIIGILAHRLLEQWDFSQATDLYPHLLQEIRKKYAPSLTPTEILTVEEELSQIFHTFFASSIYQELCQARILGREIPFALPWDGRVMEGVIDIIYEWQDSLIVADYKTDRIEGKDIAQWVEHYQPQAEVYTEATRRCLGKKEAIFKLIFLAVGVAVTLSV
jgi:ATP-dependent helicase/nuclease subunit A